MLDANNSKVKDEIFFNADCFEECINDFLSGDAIEKSLQDEKYNRSEYSLKPRDGLGMNQDLVVFDWYFPFENIFMHPLDFQWLETAGVKVPRKIDFVAIDLCGDNSFVVFYTGVTLDSAVVSMVVAEEKVVAKEKVAVEEKHILTDIGTIKPGYYAIPLPDSLIKSESTIEGSFVTAKSKKKIQRKERLNQQSLVPSKDQECYKKTTRLESLAETSNDLVFAGGRYSSGF